MAKRKSLPKSQPRKTELVAKFIAFFLVGLCLISVFKWDGKAWWLAELISLFGFQLAVLLVVGSILTLLQRQKLLSIILLVLAAFFAWPLAKSYLPAKSTTQASENETVLRLLSMELGEVMVPNEQRLEFIYTEDPTIIYLQKVQQKDASWLAELKLDYPYHQSVLSGTTYGLSILSKIPLESIQEVSFGVPDQPSLVARFTTEGKSFELIATHLLAPISAKSNQKRFAQINAIMSWVNELEKGRNPIVIGPMYASFHTTVYNRLTSISYNQKGELLPSLTDASLGFGWQPTWPTSTNLTKTVADHVFYDAKQLGCLDFKVGLAGISGGEHRPVMATFSL